MGALSHIRVLDPSRVLAGPWCAQNLGDLGFDAIKARLSRAGDDSRHCGGQTSKDVLNIGIFGKGRLLNLMPPIKTTRRAILLERIHFDNSSIESLLAEELFNDRQP